MKRFLDKRPVLAAVFIVVGLGVAVAAIAYGFTGERGGTAFYAMSGAAFGGGWCSSEGLRALLRARRRARDVGTPSVDLG
jgi:hypothetical protein